MSEVPMELTLENFGDIYKKKKQQKLLSQALIYLKLREYGCPKSRALIFAKKKQKVIDGTATRDGPAGYRKLIPEKPEGTLVNGWLKSQKLKYNGLRQFSEQLKKSESKQKITITKYNKEARAKFEQQRQREKMKHQRQLVYVPGEKKKILQQIGAYKDEFLKDREKRNLFLSCEGVRLDQYTKDYFQNIQDQNPDSLILKMGAFQTPINDERFQIQMDWQIAKGRSLNSYQIQGQSKRKKVLDFRRSLSEFTLPSTNRSIKQKKFRSTIQGSQKKLVSVTLGKSPSSKYERNIKQFDEFYNNVDKLVWLKTRRSQGQIQSKIQI